MDLLSVVALGGSLVLFIQSLFSLYLMLYTWEHPERLAASSGPQTFLPPALSFTVLLPARHEEAVIYDTIKRVVDANYPSDLLEVVVICHADDVGTIAEARRAVDDIGSGIVRIVTFSNGPISKPHGLNVGLRSTKNQVVTIFDAEDDLREDIFNVINTIMVEEEVNIVQAGVQLMNYLDHWFAVHNVLEYFFWFKSRLHFHAQVGMIPLGGNTVFVRRHLLERIGGWDEHCLTEDADIGVRLSVLGERIRVVYNPEHTTREETPDSVDSLVRQRTRWHQGFLQVLRKGDWRSLPTFGQRALALYTLSYPLLQAVLTLLWPVAVLAIIWLKLPVTVAIVSFFPLYALLLQFLATAVGGLLFAREYQLPFPAYLPIWMAITFVPFQWLLGVSAIRAVYREWRNLNNWEKTAHVGAHRKPATLEPAASATPLPVSAAVPATVVSAPTRSRVLGVPAQPVFQGGAPAFAAAVSEIVFVTPEVVHPSAPAFAAAGSEYVFVAPEVVHPSAPGPIHAVGRRTAEHAEPLRRLLHDGGALVAEP